MKIKLLLTATALLLNACLFDSSDDESSQSEPNLDLSKVMDSIEIDSSMKIDSSIEIDSSMKIDTIVEMDSTVFAYAKKAYYVGSDYAVGALYSINLEDTSMNETELSIHQDSKVFSFNQEVYVLEAYGADNIIKIDPDADTVLYQVSFAENANPYDIVPISSSQGLVAFYGVDYLGVIDLTDGSETAQIDISSYAPEGGAAHASDIEIVGDLAYVILQPSDASWNFINSQVLQVNLTTLEIVDALELSYKQCGSIAQSQGSMIASCVGTSKWNDDWTVETSDENGAIVSIDFAAKKVESLKSEKELNGKPSGSVFSSENYLFTVRESVSAKPLNALTIDGSTMVAIPGIVSGDGGFAYASESNIILAGDREASKSAIKVIVDNKVVKTLGSDKLAPSSIAVFK
jgi:hypothetical protein